MNQSTTESTVRTPVPQRPTLSPFAFAGRILPNRVVLAPMTRVSAGVEGIPTPRMRRYYGDFARGGFAAVITEGTYTDFDASQGYEGQPGMVNDLQQDAWRGIADEVRREGSYHRNAYRLRSG